MKKLHNLTLAERNRIKILATLGYNKSQISNQINRHRSTVTRELNNWSNTKNYDDYDPLVAHKSALSEGKFKRRHFRKLSSNKELLSLVKEKLKLRWSPQQISQFLKSTFPNDSNMNISHEAIYQYIYSVPRGELRKELTKLLRYQKNSRKPSAKSRKGQTKITDRISIDYRPEEVNDRAVPGHWESDLIIGKNHASCIGTIVERTTRFVIIVPLKNKSAKEVRKAFVRELKKFPDELKKTMTHDNGLEMAQHKLFTKQSGVNVYFCHPYSSWQRATNENTNGLIRDFFPKGTDFNLISKYHLKKVQRLLNERPRKVLNWKPPSQVFFNLIKKSA